MRNDRQGGVCPRAEDSLPEGREVQHYPHSACYNILHMRQSLIQTETIIFCAVRSLLKSNVLVFITFDALFVELYEMW